MAAVDADAQIVVACIRCAAAAAHPFGHHARICPGCGRDRAAIGSRGR